MNNENFIKELNNNFSREILKVTELNDKRMKVMIQSESLVRIAGFLYNDIKCRFVIASGYHTKKGFEILYHFSMDKTGHIVSLHVTLPQDKPEIETLTALFSAAEWIEREIHEILGIKFVGHPNLVKLLSKENWPEGTYPYRKDFKA